MKSLGEKLSYFREKSGHTQDSLSAQSGISRKQITGLENDYGDGPRITTLQKYMEGCGFSLSDLFFDETTENHDFIGTHSKLESVLKTGHRQSIQDVIDVFYQVNVGAKVVKSAESHESAPGETDRSGQAHAEQLTVVKDNLVQFDNNFDEMRDLQTVLVPMWDYVAAGDPSDDAYGFVGYYPVTHSKKKDGWKVIRLQGDSMEPDFKSGDFIIVDIHKQARKGDLVVAVIEGQGGTFKEFGGINKKTGTIKLVPWNKTHKAIELPADQVRIIAVYEETTRAKRGK